MTGRPASLPANQSRALTPGGREGEPLRAAGIGGECGELAEVGDDAAWDGGHFESLGDEGTIPESSEHTLGRDRRTVDSMGLKLKGAS